MKKILLILGLLVFTAARCNADDYTKFFKALHQVEAGGSLSPKDGDNGKAIGPFQIWRVYWQDSRVSGHYEQVRDYEYAKKVIAAYMQRYAPKAWKDHDYETLARIHNGGPKGHQKAATIAYWQKVKKELEKN